MDKLSNDQLVEVLYKCGIKEASSILRHIRTTKREYSLRSVQRKPELLHEHGKIPEKKYHRNGKPIVLTEQDQESIDKSHTSIL